MSFVVGLGLVFAGIVGGLAYLLLRRRAWLSLGAAALVLGAWLAWSLHPVCVPIPEEDLPSFRPPIESRTETGLAGQRYFQQREGRWYHCKAWIARALFF